MKPQVAPPSAGKSRRSRWRTRYRDELRALPYLGVWLLGVTLFFVYPLVAIVSLSFTHYDQFNAPVFTGLKNWEFVFTQYPNLYTALQNTLWLVLVMVSLRGLTGLALALLMVNIKRGAGVYRTLLFMPYLAPPVAATLAFVFLLNPIGPVNETLLNIGIHAPHWFSDPATSKIGLTMLAVWGVGDLMIIFMAALLDVPRELYDAASIDGAGRLGRFRHISLPTVKPVIVFAMVTGVIQAMQYYTQAIVAGRVASGSVQGSGSMFQPGYPFGSTLTLPQLIYSFGFQSFNVGAAAVVSVLLCALALAATWVLLRMGSGFNLGDS